MRIAINGCGVAGPTLAWWLRHYGHEPVLFEHAPALRTGGYVIDFWGTGYQIAEKMALIPDLMQDAYIMQKLQTVGRRGQTTSSLDIGIFRNLVDGRYLSIARSDLARHVFAACHGVEARFGVSVVGLEDSGDAVSAKLSDGRQEQFDLLIGADGLHSRVRSLVFGPQADFEVPLGYQVAAFTLTGYRPRQDLAYVSHTEPSRHIARVSLRDDKTLFLFICATDLIGQSPQDDAGRKAMLRRVFGEMGWEARAILARLDEVEELYYDRVSQIRQPVWCKGRVALVGDAAACPSLLAGEGTGLAMTEAYVLAGELARAKGDHVAAFAAYQTMLQPYLARKQAAALKFAGFFAPKTQAMVVVRDLLTNLAAVPFLAKLILGPSFRNDLVLPQYPKP
ncbi:MAG: FAD-binding domain [bacterium]